MEFSIPQPPPFAVVLGESWGALLSIGFISGVLSLVYLAMIPLHRQELPAAFAGPLRVLLSVHGANLALAVFLLLIFLWLAATGGIDHEPPGLSEVVSLLVLPNMVGLLAWGKVDRRVRQPDLLHVVPR